MESDDRTIIDDMPTQSGNCTSCGKEIEPIAWKVCQVCDKCIEELGNAPKMNPKFNRDTVMKCICGESNFSLYYNRVKCNKCGWESPCSLGDQFRNWEGVKE